MWPVYTGFYNSPVRKYKQSSIYWLAWQLNVVRWVLEMQRSRVEPETASLQLTTRTTNLITLGMFLVFTRSPHCIVSTEDKSVSIRFFFLFYASTTLMREGIEDAVNWLILSCINAPIFWPTKACGRINCLLNYTWLHSLVLSGLEYGWLWPDHSSVFKSSLVKQTCTFRTLLFFFSFLF